MSFVSFFQEKKRELEGSALDSAKHDFISLPFFSCLSTGFAGERQT